MCIKNLCSLAFGLCAVMAGAWFSRLAAQGSEVEIHRPLGSSIFLSEGDFRGSESFSATNRIVTTSYFYWYDVYSGAHLQDGDGTDALTDHPPTLTGFSYRSKEWHRAQLLDMLSAGIDVLLPVYWGAPSERLTNKPPEQQSWPYSGLIPLVQAREELVNEGKKPPRIGMFYDTSTLQFNAWNEHVDLTTGRGRQWFYESVRDFYSLIPPRHWAMIDGRPIIFLYSSSFARGYDQGAIDYLKSQFALEFGGRRPYLVREISWAVRSEQVYAWGGALGLRNPGVASLGPGYDHSAVPGREPLVVSREQGAFYIRNWERFLRRPSPLMTIETWNEYHEGTDVAASREYGRKYIELTAKYADMFKRGIVPPRPDGPYTDARCLSISLGNPNQEQGLRQFEWADGVTEVKTVDGSICRGFQMPQAGARYIYFQIDDSFKWAAKMGVSVVVEYYDGGPGTLRLEFDGSDVKAPFVGAYTASARVVTLLGSKQWLRTDFTLDQAVFLNSQNGGADFRLSVVTPEFYVRKVQVIRPGVKAEAYSSEDGFRFTVFSVPDRICVIEASQDLVQWRVLTQVRAGDCGTAFTDLAAKGLSLRWYRTQPGGIGAR